MLETKHFTPATLGNTPRESKVSAPKNSTPERMKKAGKDGRQQMRDAALITFLKMVSNEVDKELDEALKGV